MSNIEIELKDKKDFISKYNSNRISRDLYNYIKEEVKLTNIKEKININIKTRFKITDKEKELLALNIKKTCTEEINDIKYLEQRVLLKEIFLLIIGMFIIFLCFLIKKTIFISEIILIVGWLFIWESLDRLMFSRTQNKIKIKRLKQLVKSDINYLD